MAITAGTAFGDVDGGVGVGLGMPATLPAAPAYVKALASPQPRHDLVARCVRHARPWVPQPSISPQFTPIRELATIRAIFFDLHS
jgi:hypothetical protein